MKPFLLLSLLASLSATLGANPQLTSWFTANSGQYARIYQTTAAETAGTKSATWSRGSGTQTNPVYADVHEIAYSANWVYIKTSGLASHMMGPWYLDANKSQLFPNYPANNAVTYRIPRTPTIPPTKTSTGLGATGRMVNGVSMFDSRDAFSYSTASATDATPTNGVTGDGIWNRDGYHNEGVTFNPALAHQAGSNYHYHAHPIGLRFQLGDHVDYNATTNRYTEKSSAPTAHSPIVAWAADGLPVYGPYGYSTAMDAASGIRRMVSGFALRNGQNGTTAITVRQVLPLWAQRIQNRTTLTAAQYGPAVNATYLLGHFIEDFDYRGDLGQTLGTDFDLNEQNVRFCVTPEYPAGTWAYFTPINADGTPEYPYTTGRQYYGSPTGGAATISETVTTHFIGGPSTTLALGTPAVSGTTITLAWSAVEGGTYSVEASPNQTTWTTKGSVTSTATTASRSYTAVGTSGTEYGRVTRTALATYDTNGFTAAPVAQTATAAYNPDGTPNSLPTISGLANQSTAQNTPTATLALTVGDTETPAASLTLSGTSSNTTLVPNANITFGGAGVSRTVTVTPATNQTGSATITVTVTDAGFATATSSFTLTVTPSAPTISLINHSPSIVSSADAVHVSAQVTAPAGRTVSSVQLTYQNGSSTTATVFNETMGTAAVNGWTGTGTVYPWTVVYTGNPTSFKQTAAGNNTPAGQGNQFGMEVSGNSPTITQNTVTTTNSINAIGTEGQVQFYVSTTGITGAQGWDFQTSTDGTTWTTRINEATATNYAFALKTYTLSAAERVSTLKLRFRFAGGGMNQTPTVRLDDIKVITTTGSAPVTITLLDNGLNGDATAGDGVFGGTIPAQAVGSTVTYTITATDSTTAATTTSAGSYTALAPAPVLAVSSATTFAASGLVGGSFTPASATYTVTNTGPGSMTWTATNTAAWLTLSSPGGTLPGGASTTVTASFNPVANTLAPGTYTDTITLANTSGGNGNTTRAVSLTVSPVSTQNDGLPDTWKLANGLDPLSADPANGPDGDPDHDGRTNLVEYALNTAANTSQISPLTQTLATDPGDGLTYLTFSYPRRLGTTGLTYTVQASADLSTWPSPGTSVQELSVVPDGNGVTETVTVRLLPALASETKLFVRLLVAAE